NTSGQYDGDGMWMPCEPASFAASRSSASTAAPAGRRTSRPSSSSVYLRCQNSSRCVTTGTWRKLYSGGGDDVDHSRVRASHGSLGGTGPRIVVKMTFTRYVNTARAMMNAPIVATRLSVSQPIPFGYVYVRRGSPSKPRKCIGKNVRLNPMTISQNVV